MNTTYSLNFQFPLNLGNIIIYANRLKVTIVTISFNQHKFIAETIKSVIAQDYPNIEYIIIDAGSTDGSREIINRYSNNIHKIVFEPDQGPSDGLNKGFKYATGDIFGFLNSDDTLEPGALKSAVSQFNKYSCDVVYGNGFVIDEFGNKRKKIFSDKFSLNKYANNAFNFVQASFFFKRESFESTGGFNKDNRTCWDGELLVDIALAGCQIKRINKFWSNFRLYDNSISGSGRLNRLYEQDRLRIHQKIKKCNNPPASTLKQYFYRIINIIETPKKLIAHF